METKYLVYKNNIDKGEGSCNSESDLLRFLDLKIQKFNHLYDKNIGFFGEETIEGEELTNAIKTLSDELLDLVENYHQDADPKGFGRSAMKVEVLGRNLILDHFRCKIDQIIYSLNGLVEFLKRTEKGNGRIEIYGLGDIDVLDCNIIWETKKILKTELFCDINSLKESVEYIFNVDNIIKRNPDVLAKRLEKLEKKGYLRIKDNQIKVSEKGEVVNVWTNFIVKTVTIDREKLKRCSTARVKYLT